MLRASKPHFLQLFRLSPLRLRHRGPLRRAGDSEAVGTGRRPGLRLLRVRPVRRPPHGARVPPAGRTGQLSGQREHLG